MSSPELPEEGVIGEGGRGCVFDTLGPRDERIVGQIGLQEGCWRRGVGATSCWKVRVHLIEREGGGGGAGKETRLLWDLLRCFRTN